MNMTGYKTVVTGALSIIGGIATAMGVTLDADAVAAIATNADLVVGGGMALYGAVMIVLRAFTASPMFNKD
jgi:hypothetical protein